MKLKNEHFIYNLLMKKERLLYTILEIRRETALFFNIKSRLAVTKKLQELEKEGLLQQAGLQWCLTEKAMNVFVNLRKLQQKWWGL